MPKMTKAQSITETTVFACLESLFEIEAEHADDKEGEALTTVLHALIVMAAHRLLSFEDAMTEARRRFRCEL